LNDRYGSNTGHPTKLLGYLPEKGRKNLNLPFNVHPLDVVFAAELAVHAQQAVLTLSGKTHHSPDTDNPADAGFLRA
jgi:hypothetical protein